VSSDTGITGDLVETVFIEKKHINVSVLVRTLTDIEHTHTNYSSFKLHL